MNQFEIEEMANWILETLEGAQLQEVNSHERGLSIGLYSKGEYSKGQYSKGVSWWMILDLNNPQPFWGIYKADCPWIKSKKTKPVGLFLNSHAENLYLSEVSVLKDYGRVVRIVFSNPIQRCELELRLIPKRVNLIVKSDKKKISWAPILDLEKQPQGLDPQAEVRGIPTLLSSWKTEQSGGVKNKKTDGSGPLKQFVKDISKKKKAVENMQSTLLEQGSLVITYFELGEHLKIKGLHELKSWPESSYLNFKQSLAWNREKCFTLAKQLQRKNKGTQQRIEIVRREIRDLEDRLKRIESGQDEAPVSSQERKVLLQAVKHKNSQSSVGLKLRKKVLPSGALVYLGKSGKDNIALLRQSRPWDLWLHLRDYPGSHAIIHREKNQMIPDVELREVALWLAEESLSKKSLKLGQKLQVIVAECRFVSPIKGDTLGRVQFRSEKNIVAIYELD